MWGRPSCLAVLLILACAWIPSFAAAEGPVISESQIKAAFLYNFTKFVTWPDEAFGHERDPIVIGVFEESSLVDELRSIVAGRKVNGRGIEVRVVATVDEVKATQLLFVNVSEDARFAVLQGTIEGNPILTVGESPAFADAAGSIIFTQQDSKLRFEINMLAAERSRLKISAQLQELATAVRRTR